MPPQFKIFDEAGVLKFECDLKHMCAKHALLIEHITTIASTQLIEVEGNVEDILRKVMHIASTARDLEDLIVEYMKEFLLKDVAVATRNCIFASRQETSAVYLFEQLGYINRC